MRMRRLALVGIITFVALEGGIRDVHAQLQRTIFRGVQFAGVHAFSSNPQTGPLFNNNIYSQRLEFNRIGQGWTFENFRFFGPDTFGNPNTLDLGPIKIQLGVDPNVVQQTQPVGIHNRVGYTTTLIPEVFFQSETGQRGFDIFSGQTSFRPTPIRYDVTVNTGLQDFEWTGNIFVQTDGRINAMGFYDFNMEIVNVGNQRADGFLVHDEQVTDFDTGPINLSGHVLFDALASLAQGLGQTGAAAFPRSISAATGSINSKEKVEEIMARLNAGEEIGDAEMTFLLQQMLVTAFMEDPIGFMQGGMPDHVAGFEGLSVALSEDQPEPTVNTNVPEPGTLILVGSAVAVAGMLRRRGVKRAVLPGRG